MSKEKEEIHTPVLVLCDFDGTVCTVDMGNEILNRFTGQGWEEIDRAYCASKIGSLDAYKQVSQIFKGSRHEMLRYVHERERLDPYFTSFFHFCNEMGIDLKIVSDGLDFYIDAILKKHGLETIEYFSNVVVFSEGNTMTIEFPWMNARCEKCGTCKSSILERNRVLYETIVYVGDGYSDFCPAMKADVVFAKEILRDKCITSGKPCIPYRNFQEVQDYLQDHLKTLSRR